MEDQDSHEAEVLAARKIAKEYKLYKLKSGGLAEFISDGCDGVKASLHDIDEQIKSYKLDDSVMNDYYLQFVDHKIEEIGVKFSKKRCWDCYFSLKKAEKVMGLIEKGDKIGAGNLDLKLLGCQNELGTEHVGQMHYHDCAKYVPAMSGENHKDATNEQITLIGFYEEKTGKSFPVHRSSVDRVGRS